MIVIHTISTRFSIVVPSINLFYICLYKILLEKQRNNIILSRHNQCNPERGFVDTNETIHNSLDPCCMEFLSEPNCQHIQFIMNSALPTNKGFSQLGLLTVDVSSQKKMQDLQHLDPWDLNPRTHLLLQKRSMQICLVYTYPQQGVRIYRDILCM